MIHSMAGGALGNQTFNDFAKVRLLEGLNKGEIYWYLAINNLKEGDKVIVPFGLSNKPIMGEVLKVDKGVSSFVSPVPVKKAKKIIRIVEER